MKSPLRINRQPRHLLHKMGLINCKPANAEQQARALRHRAAKKGVNGAN